jgi:hypothetical protein
MRHLFSTVLAILAIISAIGGWFAATNLPNDLAELDREPEDFYLNLYWLIFALLFLSYCAYGAFKGFGSRPVQTGKVGWVISAILLALGILMFVEASTDPALWVLGIVVVLAPASYVSLGVVTRLSRQHVVLPPNNSLQRP